MFKLQPANSLQASMCSELACGLSRNCLLSSIAAHVIKCQWPPLSAALSSWLWLLAVLGCSASSAPALLQATKQQHRSGKILLESWVDDVLTNSPWLQQQQHTSAGTVRGAVAAGLSRQQLLAAGLSAGAVEQLHRCLYVYSMGFVDTVKVRNCCSRFLPAALPAQRVLQLQQQQA